MTTLDLPLESFLLVPIQVLFGNPQAIVNTVIAIILTPFLIYITLWLLTLLGNTIDTRFHHLSRASTTFRLIRSLLNEIVIVFWILLILFNLARHQGLADARRDVVNKTSTLPVVTFITPKEQLVLGKN